MVFDDFGTGGNPSGFNVKRGLDTIQSQRNNTFDFFSAPQESTQAMDMYNQHLNAIPERTRPGVGNRILSALAGGFEGYRRGPMAGISAAQNVYEEPYQRKLEDYKTKGSILGQRARLEQESNETKYRNYITALRAREDAESRLRDDERADKAQISLENWREWQKGAKDKDDWVLNTNETTGELIRVNKFTGQVVPLIKTKQTPDEKIQSDAKRTKAVESAREPFVQGRMNKQGQINKDVAEHSANIRFGQRILGDKMGLGQRDKDPSITAAERLATESTSAWNEFKKKADPKQVQLVESFMDIDPRTRAPQFVELNSNNAKVLARQYGYDLDDEDESQAFFEAYNRAKRIYNSSMMRR